MEKGTMFLGAPPKHLKTMLAMQLAYCIATGRDFLGWKTTANGVLYIEQEIGLTITKERYEAMRRFFGDDHVNMQFWAKDKNRLSLRKDYTGSLEQTIKDVRPQVVVFDPFRKMTTGADENSSGDVTQVFEQLTRLQEEYGFASVLVHHTAKPSEERRACAPEALRGSSEIFAHGDTYGIFCNSQKNGTEVDVHWTFRNHAPIDPWKLQFNESEGVVVRRKPPEPKKKKEEIADGLLKAE
jgi:RecA-family ATPase